MLVDRAALGLVRQQGEFLREALSVGPQFDHVRHDPGRLPQQQVGPLLRFLVRVLGGLFLLEGSFIPVDRIARDQ